MNIEKEVATLARDEKRTAILVRQMVAGVSELRSEIRSEVETEVQAKAEQEYQHKLEEDLAQLGVVFRNGVVEDFYGQTQGGIFEMSDSSFAREYANMLSESWMPLVVKANGKDGKVKESAVREAIIGFLSGSPLDDGAIAGDESSGLTFQVMRAAEQRWKIDPNVRSALRSIGNYVIGRGVTIQAANPDITSAMRDYWRMNSMPLRILDAVPRKLLFGEHYFVHRVAKNGDIFTFDKTQPYEIGKVITHPEDHLRPLAYGRLRPVKGLQPQNSQRDEDALFDWFPDIDYFEQLDSPIGINLTSGNSRLSGKQGDTFSRQNRMQALRLNMMGSIRGFTDMYATLRWYKIYEDFVMDRAILNHERSKVVWIRKVMGSGGIPGGRAQRSPKGGQVLTETENIEWKAVNAQINASDVSEDGRLIRLMISAGWGVPEHVLFQDPSNQVYASIRAQDTPFSQMVLGNQRHWSLDLQKTFRFVIREKVRLKRLPRRVPVEVFRAEARQKMDDEIKPMIREGASEKEIGESIRRLLKEQGTQTVKVDSTDVKLRIDFPDVVQMDPLKKAQVSEVLKRAVLASATSLSAEHGFEWQEEINEISQERDDMVSMGLVDSKILPMERERRTPSVGIRNPNSPTTRNEPSADDDDDEVPTGDSD
jgi:hypothetical protein